MAVYEKAQHHLWEEGQQSKGSCFGLSVVLPLTDFTRWNECLELWTMEDSGLVGCDAVSLLEWFWVCPAITVPSSWRVKEDHLTLQDEGTTGTTHTRTQHRIPGDLNPLQHCDENLNYHCIVPDAMSWCPEKRRKHSRKNLSWIPGVLSVWNDGIQSKGREKWLIVSLKEAGLESWTQLLYFQYYS